MDGICNVLPRTGAVEELKRNVLILATCSRHSKPNRTLGSGFADGARGPSDAHHKSFSVASIVNCSLPSSDWSMHQDAGAPASADRTGAAFLATAATAVDFWSRRDRLALELQSLRAM